MGLGGILVKMMGAILGMKGNAPGNSVIVKAEGFDGQTFEPEVYQAPGVFGIPGDGSRGVWIPLGGSSRYGVVLAMQNYSLNIEISAGETAIYSTDSTGQILGAVQKFKSDGTIEINGNSKFLVTHAELNTALQAMVTAINAGFATKLDTPGAPGTVTIDITAAKTTTIKTGG